MTRVSIIIPCYNAGEHLAEAVQSALAQTLPDVEIIVVDDGSTDTATLSLLDESTWPRTRIFRQSNAGPAAARNRAIREATGAYILPLDADDRLDPRYAAKAMAVLDECPDVGIVYCLATKFGTQNGPWKLPEFSPDELALGNVIFVSAMFRKTDWQAIGGFDETLRFGMEDYDFWIRLVHAGRGVLRLDEPLFQYRVRERSRTAQFEQEREQVVTTYATIFRNNREFFAEHAGSLFRRHFSMLDQITGLHERLARESTAAANERTALIMAKGEADRRNSELRSALSELQSALDELRVEHTRMQRRFRWLRPLWPRKIRDSQGA